MVLLFLCEFHLCGISISFLLLHLSALSVGSPQHLPLPLQRMTIWKKISRKILALGMVQGNRWNFAVFKIGWVMWKWFPFHNIYRHEFNILPLLADYWCCWEISYLLQRVHISHRDTRAIYKRHIYLISSFYSSLATHWAKVSIIQNFI